jgi:5'-methylthioinosine phosphorylase
MSIELAVIGGSGLYQFEGLSETERLQPDTPYGPTSGAIVVGKLDGHRVAFLARHGESHTIPPHRVNYRANVYALHALGATRVIGVNAVGGIRDDMGPRVLAVPDQIIDYTHGRYTSFCDVEGAKVEHVDFSHPYTETLRQRILAAGRATGVALVDGGSYGATQGPRLETVAEIARLRRDGSDLVGMTGMPEAVLARELGMHYACIALVANWAAGCGDQIEISIDEIFAILRDCTAKVPPMIRALLAQAGD